MPLPPSAPTPTPQDAPRYYALVPGAGAGSRKFFDDMNNWARAEGRPCVVATFDPHPVRFFAPDAAPFRLTTLDQRQELFEAAGADAMLVFHFDAELAGTTAQEFVVDLLVARLGAAGVVTGTDFTFGKARGGNITVLAELGSTCGLATRAVGPVADRAVATVVRQKLDIVM